MRIPALILICFGFMVLSQACKREPEKIVDPAPDYGNFPEAVGVIFGEKCAVAGCHNDKSYTGAGDLRLDNWEHLFSGAENGASVIAYSPQHSPMLYFTNTDSSLGLVADPRMPKDAAPLSRQEYLTLRDWIAAGAPDKDGNVPFSSDADKRQKIYMTQQGCDLISVIDAKTKMVMRYIQVGNQDGVTEAPHNVKFTQDGKYAFVCFSSGSVLQKIDAGTDKVVGAVDLNAGRSISSSFNVLTISADGSEVLVSDWVADGRLILVDANAMRIKTIYNGGFVNPHGVISNASFDTFFVTAQSGNVIYRLAKNGDVKIISLDGRQPTTVSGDNTPDPHDLIMTPDYSKYFVTCEKSGQVIVVDAHTDKVIKTINLGRKPQELALSQKTGKVFVTCMEEPSAIPGNYKGAVYAIDYTSGSYNWVKIDGKFSQPHGIAVDDADGLIYVSSVNTTGPPPHHPSACDGSNGYYQVFDLHTYQPYTGADRRYEVSVQPYSADIRFKNTN